MKKLLKRKWAGLLLAAGMSFGLSGNMQAQCPGTDIAYNGDMEIWSCPVTTTTINSCLDNWAVSHGSPTPMSFPTPFASPTAMWVWSYYDMGEGVYMGHNFVAGRTYCVTFHARTTTHDGTAPNASARFWVVATSSLSPGGVAGGGQPIPVLTPGTFDVVADQNWAATGPSGTIATYTYTFTATSNWSELWFYPQSPTLPQVELLFDQVVITDITAPDPCDFEPRFEWHQERCKVVFDNVSYVGPGITLLGVQWDFGDGTTSTQWSPSHYYTSPGGYSVVLRMWYTDGERCCYKEFKKEIFFQIDQRCSPCRMLIEDLNLTVEQTGTTLTFNASNPTPYQYGYYWDFGDGTTGVGSPISHTYQPGWYVLCLTVFYLDPRGECCSDRICRRIYIDGGIDPTDPIDDTKSMKTEHPMMENVPLERPSDNQLKLYAQPNPSGGIYRLHTDEQVKSGTLQVMDMQGKVIREDKYAETSTWNLDIANLPAGTYFVRIQTADGKTFNTMLLKE